MSAARRLQRDERGAALVLVALWLAALAAVAGLVADGGTLLAERRALQNAADAAAAAGAMQLDQDRYRASGGADVSLDTAAAERAAEGYLAGRAGLAFNVSASATRVEVVAARLAPTTFLRLVGITHVAIRARASAEPRHGVVSAPLSEPRAVAAAPAARAGDRS